MRDQVRDVVTFANAALHERNWRERVGAGSVERLVGLATPSMGPVAGIESLDQALAIQHELRHVLNQIVDVAEAGTFPKRVEIAAAINARVQVRIVYKPDATENRLHAEWETAESSVAEFLYVQLAQSLAKDGFDVYGRCPTCGNFIYRRTRHGQRYCSDGCRALASFRRQRDGHEDESPSAAVTKVKPARRSRRPS